MQSRDAFDLFNFLGKLNRRDLQAYDNLTLEGKKAASPLVIMRWLSGTSDQAQIVRLNTFANRYIFSLGKEPTLLFKLLAASCTGNTRRVAWIKGPGGGSRRLAAQAVMDRYEISSREVQDYLSVLSAADIVECAEAAGWEKDQLKKLTTELGKDDDTGSRPSAKSSRKPSKQ